MGNIERIGVAKCSMNLPSHTTAISSSTEFSDMAVEMHRLISFGTWPHKNEFPQPSALGSAGFYYTGEADKTKCFSCEGEVLNWRSDMYPDEIHRTRFPDCLLVKGEETRHKPMQPSAEGVKNDETFFRKKLKELSFIYRDSTIALQSSNPHGMTNPVLVKHRQSRVATGSHGSLMPLSSPASVTPAVDYTDEQENLWAAEQGNHNAGFQPACYPMYADEDRRLKTFRKETEEVRDEAKAGFFCESCDEDDRVKCYNCGLCVSRWNTLAGTDPWKVHAKFSPGCQHVASTKGQEFINENKTDVGAWIKDCLWHGRSCEVLLPDTIITQECDLLSSADTLDSTPMVTVGSLASKL